MGRPSREQRKMLDDGFDVINDSFAALAGKVGFPVARVKQMWSQKNRMLMTKPRGGNGVNYFNLYGKLSQ
ncbi:hypothetical protein CC1G_15128 [Coprinopsis cinerea okayama7|uniref:Uncharacterized protein n=1 Tax=Coprinopsis cinerea (strain Okayama-7 / 130 / ATCC MYA-4618 / FGSC 9003) TaxID=240176 RepID=D6RPL9_COPC7|nr:hypothetical protein CC1G_15128 [Coprinopsis cinerea okayama7\|eukprot:XP_002910488.1 hypothetical protein CC1G_15128 [Coprinopsis cinerea okayama7\